MTDFREWAPMDFLMSRVPPLTRYARDQSVTAIAVTEDIIALGTDTGTLFWYSRREDSLQRIKCPGPSASIVSLDLVETVDYMLAAGSRSGDLILYQIAKPVKSETRVPFPGTDRNIQQFLVTNIHRQSVTCLKWSKNGEKLFSGDEAGKIVESSVSFIFNEVSSREISEEMCEILSLDYLFADYNTRLLLVSTINSTFAYSFNSRNEKNLVKIGGRSRKTGTFASMCLQTAFGKAGVKFVVVRPKDRLWVTDVDGRVERTIILREAIKRSHLQIPLINPSNMAGDEDTNVARVSLLSAAEQLVIVWSEASLHIVSLVTGQVLNSCNSFRKIYNICRTSDEEMFIHETGRSIVRLGVTKDNLIPDQAQDWRRLSSASQAADTALESTLENLGSRMSKHLPHVGKLQMSSHLNIESIKVKLSNIVGSNDSCMSPEVVDALIGLDYKKTDSLTDVRSALDKDKFSNKDFLARMDSIGRREYDEEIVANTAKKSQRKSRTSKCSINEAPVETRLDTALATFTVGNEDKDEQHAMSSLEKEEKLMKILKIEEEEIDSCKRPSDHPDPLSEKVSRNSSINAISYGPPSDGSNVTSNILSNDLEHGPRLKDVPEADPILLSPCVSQDQELEAVAEQIEDGLYHYKLPGQAGSLSVSETMIWFCDNRENVFYSEIRDMSRLLWRRAKFKASSVVTSPCGSTVWRLHHNTALSLVTEAGSGQHEWRRLCDNVRSIWLGDSTGWLVKLDGGLVRHENLGPSSPQSLSPRQIYTGHSFLLVVEANGWLLGLTSTLNQIVKCPLEQLTSEDAWLTVPWPNCGPPVSVFVVSPRGHLWVTDTRGGVHVSQDWETWASLPVTSLNEVTATAFCHPVLVTGICGLWLTSPLSTSVFLRWYPVTAYSWSQVSLFRQVSGMKIQTLEAGGWDTWGGSLLLTDKSGVICSADLSSGTLSTLSIPSQETVAMISAVPKHIWLLTNSGKIFIKKRSMSSWYRVNLDELGSVRLMNVSLASTPSTGHVWAVDTSGSVYLRMGSLDPPPSCQVSPSWLPVDTQGVAEGVRIVQVVSSGGGDMVWARDSDHGVYVREGVFTDDHPQGTGWVAVTGMLVSGLTLSRSSVWAVSHGGGVFRRLGITPTNWLGDAWTQVPGPRGGQVTALAAGQCDTLWALDMEGNIVQMTTMEVEAENTKVVAEEEEDGWITL